jgi:hypothetical protein
LTSRYFILPLILLVISVGFSSVAFADDSTALYSSDASFDSPIDYYLLDGRHLTLDPTTFDPTSDSVLSPDVTSANPSDNLSYSSELSGLNSMSPSEIGLDNRDETSSMIAVLLFAIPFGALVLRMSDEESLSRKYLKLSSVVMVLGMVSLLTGQTLTVGNSFWGYAFAEIDPDVFIPNAIDSLQFDHSDKDNVSFMGGTAILEQENPAAHFDGKDSYLSLDSELPSKLKNFSVSAWVKPDYSDGSAVFSVAGESEAFT